MKSQSHQAARWYAQQRGWRVLPLHAATEDGKCTCGRAECSSVAKHPRTAHGVADATTDPATIAAWWQRWPEANVGIATGPESGVVVLDVDPRHGGDDALAELEATHGKLPETVEALTGGGGRHIFFEYPAQHVANSAGQLGCGLDVRGAGGYVVAPPSVHASGRAYEWEGSSRPDEVAVASMPEWLLETKAERRPAKSPDHWCQLVTEGVSEGARNQSLTSLAGHLLRSNVAPEAARELLLCWNKCRCKPPLDDREVHRVVDSITKRDQQRPRTTRNTMQPVWSYRLRQLARMRQQTRGQDDYSKQ